MSKIHFQFKKTQKPHRAACGVLSGRIFLSSNDWSEVTCSLCRKRRSRIEKDEKYINNDPHAYGFYTGNNANQHKIRKKDFDRHEEISKQVKSGSWLRGREAYKGQFKV